MREACECMVGDVPDAADEVALDLDDALRERFHWFRHRLVDDLD